jgi:RNase P subunit RPR2
MIEVLDTTAARIALARRMLVCPACDQPLRPWGHARERTIRDQDGALPRVRPDRALCTGCGASHVVLDAGLLRRRSYAAGLIGQALVASALAGLPKIMSTRSREF